MKTYMSFLFVIGLSILTMGCASLTPQPQEAEKVVYIGPELVDCVGVSPQKCLEVKDSPDGTYTPFYGKIEGFDYQEGNAYTVVVKETNVENPPADASSITWSLVKVESMEPISSGSDSVDITKQAWTLGSYLGSEGQMLTVIPGSETTLEFKEQNVAGKAGCNSYFGSYQLSGDQLTFGGIGATEMYCGSPAGIMDQESAYLALLGEVKSYRFQDGQLVMQDSAGKDVLVYSSLEPTSLVGTSWQVINYNNGKDAVVSVLGGTNLTAEFGEDGSITGSAGCNNYFGKYEVDGNTIKIGPLASTKMACAEPTGIMEQETAYLIALESAATFQITGDQLVLFNADGSRAVDYLAGKSQSLEGSSWELLSITGYDGDLTTAKDNTPITLLFDQSGNVSGYSGCNQFSGGYQVNGSEIKIGPLISTQMACLDPASVMELESKYLSSLDAAGSFQLTNESLILQDAEGTQLLEFRATVP